MSTPRRFTPDFPAAPLVDAILDRALEEDLAGGDLTSEACVDVDVRARAVFLAKSDLAVCGLGVAVRVFERLRAEGLAIGPRVADGTRCAKGTSLLELSGPARALLAGERVALNLLQRMTGVATLTRRHVDAIPAGARTRIVDTRKTTPGLRVLERYAVRCGGGVNHRDSLGSAVLIKDNHIVASGGVAAAIARAKAWAPHSARIECEVETMAQLDEALTAGADVVMLDNMDDAEVRAAVARVRAVAGDRVSVEASGGITLGRITALAEAGVDVISVGALTHSAPAADISLDLSL